MKSKFLLTLAILATCPAQASPVHNALKACAVAAAVASSAVTVSHAFAKKPAVTKVTSNLSEGWQECMRSQLAYAYSSPKPLLFRIGRRGSHCFSTPDANVISISAQEFVQAVDPEASCEYEEAINRINTWSDDQFKRAIEKIMGILLHEVGHLVHNHCHENLRESRVEHGIAITISVCANSAIAYKVLKTNLPVGFLLYGIAISGYYAWALEHLRQRSFFNLPKSRRLEREADAFAIKHLNTIEDLENFKAFFHSIAKKRTALEKTLFALLPFLSTHPTDENRIAAIDQAIAAKKQETIS